MKTISSYFKVVCFVLLAQQSFSVCGSLLSRETMSSAGPCFWRCKHKAATRLLYVASGPSELALYLLGILVCFVLTDFDKYSWDEKGSWGENYACSSGLQSPKVMEHPWMKPHSPMVRALDACQCQPDVSDSPVPVSAQYLSVQCQYWANVSVSPMSVPLSSQCMSDQCQCRPSVHVCSISVSACCQCQPNVSVCLKSVSV